MEASMKDRTGRPFAVGDEVEHFGVTPHEMAVVTGFDIEKGYLLCRATGPFPLPFGEPCVRKYGNLYEIEIVASSGSAEEVAPKVGDLIEILKTGACSAEVTVGDICEVVKVTGTGGPFGICAKDRNAAIWYLHAGDYKVLVKSEAHVWIAHIRRR